MFFKVPEGRLYYEIRGTSLFDPTKPTLFVLPGGPGYDHTLYKQYLSSLEPLIQVIYHDPRGCGLSSVKNVTSCTLENYIADVEALRNHLGLEKISLLGTSYGSMAAIGYAISYSSHIDNLILVAGAASHRFLVEAKQNLKMRGNEMQQQVCEKLWKGTFANQEEFLEFMQIMRPLYSNKAKASPVPPLDPQLADHFSIAVCNFEFKTFMNTFDFEPQLHNIRCKTLIICGKEDWINDPHQAEILAQNIPHSTLVKLGSGHSIATDCYDDYIKLVKETLVDSIS